MSKFNISAHLPTLSSHNDVLEIHDGMNDLMDLTDENISAYKELCSYLKKRLSLEEDYIKGTKKLTKSFMNVESTSSYKSFKETLENCDKLGTYHFDLVRHLANETAKNLQDTEHHRKALKAAAEKVTKEFKNFEQAERKTRVKFDNSQLELSECLKSAKVVNLIRTLRRKCNYERRLNNMLWIILTHVWPLITPKNNTLKRTSKKYIPCTTPSTARSMLLHR